jgi:endonuclease/exonuclease/phosphatase family metal-dependent hydrolase
MRVNGRVCWDAAKRGGAVLAMMLGLAGPAAAQNIVLTGANATTHGEWTVASDSGASVGKVVRHVDGGDPKLLDALANPNNYFELTFQATAGKPYRIWVRGKAQSSHYANDSAYVQFSGSVTSSGAATYRIGSTSATEISLQETNGASVSGWLWQDNGWGQNVLGPKIYFGTTGTQRIRVQTREDGLSIDQIVLSDETYLSTRPSGILSATSGLPVTSPSPSPTPAPTGGTTLKFLQWNIHHGVGQDGKYDIPRFVTWIAKWRPDVISINEAEKYTGWGNEDQPARFRALIEAATGQKWYYHFAQEYGNWTSNGKGNLLLSRFPFVATGREVLSWERTIAFATVVVNGRNITVASTHWDPESRDRRLTQAKQTVSQAAQFADPRIVAGDLNAWPDQTSIAEFGKSYYDSWAKAEAAGTASSFSGNSPFGATKNGRIDYIWYSKGSSTVLSVVKSQVPDTRDSSGRMPSDHRPVLTTFTVK